MFHTYICLEFSTNEASLPEDGEAVYAYMMLSSNRSCRVITVKIGVMFAYAAFFSKIADNMGAIVWGDRSTSVLY
jgi:hypothetical protein